MAAAVVAIVTEQLLTNTNVLRAGKLGKSAGLVDPKTLDVACVLWDCVIQQFVCDHVLLEADKRNLMPISIHSLATLLCEAIALYRNK